MLYGFIVPVACCMCSLCQADLNTVTAGEWYMWLRSFLHFFVTASHLVSNVFGFILATHSLCSGYAPATLVVSSEWSLGTLSRLVHVGLFCPPYIVLLHECYTLWFIHVPLLLREFHTRLYSLDSACLVRLLWRALKVDRSLLLEQRGIVAYIVDGVTWREPHYQVRRCVHTSHRVWLDRSKTNSIVVCVLKDTPLAISFVI